ncbi:progranulin-like [Hyperolius riggenbachi]|uniref:progranulin-like n=1 Tax=Hyperolius riggenbachi TaxID=752182 RepID=UPI0035A264DE
MAPPWYLMLLVTLVGAWECPDGTVCGEHTVCCMLPNGEVYGCCPQDEVLSRPLPMITLDLPCTVHAGCPDEYSCVSTPDGTSACCPLDQGISCKDGHHCCPTGSQCSEDGHSCLPAINQSAVICPDGSSECPNDATCCQMSDQSWGCCPLQQAICCSDHAHCCPHDTKCDLEHGSCVSGNSRVPMSKKFPAKTKLLVSVLLTAEKLHRTNCSDGSTCPDGSTCCDLGDRTFGCCPMIAAVCCGDHIHCCPAGTNCDLTEQKCVSGDSKINMFTKTPALREEATVQCDATSVCPGSETCCRLASGEWGCCPFASAMCCADKEHCCPPGTTCTASGSCHTGSASIPWLQKTPALKATVKCDDTSECPGTDTCCRLASGEWGCCPIPNAVCCPDKEHCCPSGTTCTGSGSCQGDTISIPWLQKMPALKQETTVKCDDTSECPGTDTCCRLASGEWGCCPIPNAVCCPDKEHCCPSGTTCTGSGSCQGDTISIPWLHKMPALKQKSLNVTCDVTSACPDDTTCCRLASGKWGCCPIKQAVCCSDHQHCCPSGYTCDVSAGTCNKPLEAGASLGKPIKKSLILGKPTEKATKPPKPAGEALVRMDVVWCNSTHACYDGAPLTFNTANC